MTKDRPPAMYVARRAATSTIPCRIASSSRTAEEALSEEDAAKELPLRPLPRELEPLLPAVDAVPAALGQHDDDDDGSCWLLGL